MMSTETSAFIIVFVLSFGITLTLLPLMIRIGKQYGITSQAGGRRRNDGDFRGVPKLGGVAVYFGFTATVIIAQYLNVPRFDDAEVIRLTGMVLGGTLIFLVSLVDDVLELSPVQIGVAQIITAGIAIAFQIFIETFNNPITGTQTDPWPFAVTVIITMFWLGLMMNTVNFMDGLDGLVGGVAFIACATLFANSAYILTPAQTSVALLPLAMMGSSVAFILFNFYPAQIFLGGGAYFIGYTLGTLSIIGGAKMATILLVMGLPLMDLAWQVANRMLQGRNPMHGDRGHIHFRLLDMGFTQRQIVSVYYLFCASFGVLTLITASRLFKFMAFSTMILLIMGGFVLLTRLNQMESSISS